MLRKKYLSLPFFAILTTLTFWVPKEALAISIKATATGSPNPTPVAEGNLQNGDFLILRPTHPNFINEPVGDGRNESTSWLFDFSSDSNLALFPTSRPLDSALLTLTLSPGEYYVITDTTGYTGGTLIDISSIPGIPAVGTTGTVSIDLLDFGFTSADIINSFDFVTNTIPWYYQDDSVISSAELELTAESVPEPTNILGLLVTGAIGAGILKGKKQEN